MMLNLTKNNTLKIITFIALALITSFLVQSVKSASGCYCLFRVCACFKPDYYYLGDNTAMLSFMNGSTLFVYTKDSHIAKNLITVGEWEPNERILINREFITPNSRIIEVGSNYGTYTTTMGRKIALNKGHIHAFEANPFIAELLTRSMATNFTGKYTIYNTAVFSTSGKTVQFSLNELNVGAGKIINSKQNTLSGTNQKHGLQQYFTQTTVALDDVFKDDLKFDFIRMDAEGSEFEILKGSKSILENSPEIIVYMEWSPSMLSENSNVEEELTKYLDAGYNFYEVLKYKIEPISKSNLLKDQHTNVVFSKKKLMQ